MYPPILFLAALVALARGVVIPPTDIGERMGSTGDPNPKLTSIRASG